MFGYDFYVYVRENYRELAIFTMTGFLVGLSF